MRDGIALAIAKPILNLDRWTCALRQSRHHGSRRVSMGSQKRILRVLPLITALQVT